MCQPKDKIQPVNFIPKDDLPKETSCKNCENCENKSKENTEQTKSS